MILKRCSKRGRRPTTKIAVKSKNKEELITSETTNMLQSLFATKLKAKIMGITPSKHLPQTTNTSFLLFKDRLEMITIITLIKFATKKRLVSTAKTMAKTTDRKSLIKMMSHA